MAFASSLAARPGRRLAAAVLALAAAGAAIPRHAGAGESPALASVERLLAEAREMRADLLAPRQFAAAERELEAARSAKPEEFEKRLARAADATALAMTAARESRGILGPALAARDAAMAALADSLAKKSFAEGERDFREAAAKAGTGDEQAARIKAADAERRFRAAELSAIEGAVLGAARAQLAAAVAAGAGEWAPASLARAREKAGAAADLLGTDRSRRGEAEALAAEGVAAAERATAIAEKAGGSERDKGAYEAMVLAVDAEIAAISAALGQEAPSGADPLAGLRTASEQIQGGIAALQSDREALAKDLARAREEIATLSVKERGLSAELEVQREREERLRRVREIFAPDEAVLVRESGSLILRLKGVRFAEGQNVILPESYALLAKVMRAMRELPGAGVAIEGHTDAKGDEKKNLVLSTARAEAVRIYLETNMDLSDRLVTTVGRGETAPIASNDTEAGRAQNRRIDLIFDARTLLGE